MSRLLCTLFIILVPSTIVAANDFESAQKAFEQGKYKLAEVYLTAILQEETLHQHIPDAFYYLVRIDKEKKDLPSMLCHATTFLDTYAYDERAGEVLTLVLSELNQRQAFAVAYDYVRKYDFLIQDYALIETIGHGLLSNDMDTLANAAFSLCPASDTLRIMRALLSADVSEKKAQYASIPGLKGTLYTIELFLAMGDTVGAYELYRTTDLKDISDSMLYRYAKIARLFDHARFANLIGQLKNIKEYTQRALLLEALSTSRLETPITPRTQEEYSLLMAYWQQDTISRQVPQELDIASLTDDSLGLQQQRSKYFYLDSLYSHMLTSQNRVHDAYAVIAPYMKYRNTEHYARLLRALHYYDEGTYDLAAKDFILSGTDDPAFVYRLAQALRAMGKQADYLYAEIIEGNGDTTLVVLATRQLVRIYFEQAHYQGVVGQRFTALDGDTTAVKLYCYSLARRGTWGEAQSLFAQFFDYEDYELANYYGEYLISEKKYKRAQDYFDSLIIAETVLPGRVYYNWALAPFLVGDVDTALERFRFCIKRLPEGRDYFRTLFKIATIHYVKQEFDSAAYYYGAAAKDDSLRITALENQLICYKKSQEWMNVVQTGTFLLPLSSDESKPNVRFEIGYALLRAGNTKGAIENLKEAAYAKPNPEYYYWLAEAYCARAEFTKALYQFYRITELFPKDEMWTPTALYKTGIVLEFMDETDEAIKTYKQIIKKRGVHDTWSIEAQKRLDEIE